jgi:hypothetical protein
VTAEVDAAVSDVGTEADGCEGVDVIDAPGVALDDGAIPVDGVTPATTD